MMPSYDYVVPLANESNSSGRSIMASSWENVKVDNSSMPLYVSVPESGGPIPGIVVVHGQSGLENFIKDTTHMFALQGYAAVAPNLYHRDAPDCKDDNPT